VAPARRSRILAKKATRHTLEAALLATNSKQATSLFLPVTHLAFTFRLIFAHRKKLHVFPPAAARGLEPPAANMLPCKKSRSLEWRNWQTRRTQNPSWALCTKTQHIAQQRKSPYFTDFFRNHPTQSRASGRSNTKAQLPPLLPPDSTQRKHSLRGLIGRGTSPHGTVAHNRTGTGVRRT
jgi:hypothetical protein